MKKGDAIIEGLREGAHTCVVGVANGIPTISFPKKDYTRKRAIWKLELMGIQIYCVLKNEPLHSKLRLGYWTLMNSEKYIWVPAHTKTLWCWRIEPHH